MAFNIPLFNDLARAWSDELPDKIGNDTLDDHVDYILPHVRAYGEDLREPEFWLGKRWKEIRDDATFHETILHVFNPPNEYMLVVDGNILRGSWRQMVPYNSFILEIGGRSELFDLAFLNPDFMILKKHGDQARKGQRKYFVLAHEYTARNIDWRNLMELLYNVYRSDSGRYSAWLIFILVVVGIILALSFG